jgi:hypothetical protein
MDFHRHLEALGADFYGAPADEAHVSYVESLIAAQFPKDYRDYLVSVPRVHFAESVFIGCREPTPFGVAHFHSMHSISDVEGLLDSDLTPRNMITIATGNLNKYVCLSIVGIDHGAVYALDGDYRCFWDDNQFQRAFPNMADSIREYLAIRARDELPDKPFSYSTLYRIADSFTEFVEGLSKSDET